MTDLAAILNATRKSASAVDRIARYSREWRTYKSDRAWRGYIRALSDYETAQRTLAANPLPGDRVEG